MNLDGRKLAPSFVWLFALASLGISIAATKLVPHPLGPKAWAGIYFAVFGAGAAAATFLTRSGALRAIGAFAIGGLGLGAFYYVAITRHAGSSGIGGALGIVFAVVFLVVGVAGGVGGALFGLKLRKNLAGPLLRT